MKIREHIRKFQNSLWFIKKNTYNQQNILLFTSLNRSYVHSFSKHLLIPESSPEAGGGYYLWSGARHRGSGEREDPDFVGTYCEYTRADRCQPE